LDISKLNVPGREYLWARSSMSASRNFDAANGGEDSLRQEWVLAFLPYSQGFPGCVCRNGLMLNAYDYGIDIGRTCTRVLYIPEHGLAPAWTNTYVIVFNLRLSD
jgi:hypothetical protein